MRDRLLIHQQPLQVENRSARQCGYRRRFSEAVALLGRRLFGISFPPKHWERLIERHAQYVSLAPNDMMARRFKLIAFKPDRTDRQKAPPCDQASRGLSPALRASAVRGLVILARKPFSLPALPALMLDGLQQIRTVRNGPG